MTAPASVRTLTLDNASECTYVLQVTPIPCPRLSHRGKHSPRARRYHDWCNAVRAIAATKRLTLPDAGIHVVFQIPMPDSWSHAKRERMHGTPHQSRPDVDNLFKALADALRPDGDASIWQFAAEKCWSYTGHIVVTLSPSASRVMGEEE